MLDGKIKTERAAHIWLWCKGIWEFKAFFTLSWLNVWWWFDVWDTLEIVNHIRVKLWIEEFNFQANYRAFYLYNNSLHIHECTHTYETRTCMVHKCLKQMLPYGCKIFELHKYYTTELPGELTCLLSFDLFFQRKFTASIFWGLVKPKGMCGQRRNLLYWRRDLLQQCSLHHCAQNVISRHILLHGCKAFRCHTY